MGAPPLVVVLASALELALATSFVLMAAAARVHGSDAQRAAEDEVAMQGFHPGVLEEHGVTFEERGAELLLPIVIALFLATLASLDLAGAAVGRTLTWIGQPIVLVCGGIVTARQVFTVHYLERAFERAEVERVNVRNFVEAALRAFPRGFYSLVVTRFVLSTAGSVLVIVLLALPSADAHFR